MRRNFLVFVLVLACCFSWSCAPKKGGEPRKEAKSGEKKTIEKASASVVAPETTQDSANDSASKLASAPAPVKTPKLILSANSELAELIGSLEYPHKGAPVLRTLIDRAREGDKVWVKEALATLRRALNYPKPNARSQAAQILILFAQKRKTKLEKQSVAALGDALVSDPDGDVRALIAKAVGASKDSRLGVPLIRVLDDDKSGSARAAAAKALGALRVRSATMPLIRALDDREVRVRINSVNALRKLKAKQAVSRLIPMLEDENQMVRSRVHKTLKDLTGKRLPADPGAWR